MTRAGARAWSEVVSTAVGVLTALFSVFCGLPDRDVAAQTNDEINSGLQLDFSPPGARSLGLGHAFVGLADDATAAYTNPAGLLWLTRPEVSVEVQHSAYKSRYPSLGGGTGRPTNCDGPRWRGSDTGCLDTPGAPVSQDFETSTDRLSFLSYVHVFGHGVSGQSDAGRARSKWRLALYRHQLADYRIEIEQAEGAFLGGTDTGRAIRSRLAAIDGELGLEIENVGAVVAHELLRSARGRLWSGIGVVHSSFELASETRRYRSIVPDSNQGNPALPGPTDFSDANVTAIYTQRGADEDWVVHAGLLWRAESARWSVGLVYRQGPDFDFGYDFRWGEGARAEAALADDPNITDAGIERALSGASQFEVPSVLALGFAVKLTPSIRVSFELDRVGYSALEPENNILVNGLFPSENRRCGDWLSGGARLDPPVPLSEQSDEARSVHDRRHLGGPSRIRVQLRSPGEVEPQNRSLARPGSPAPVR